jgi:hypothetical protein
VSFVLGRGSLGGGICAFEVGAEDKGLRKESKNRRANKGLYQDWIGIWHT